MRFSEYETGAALLQLKYMEVNKFYLKLINKDPNQRLTCKQQGDHIILGHMRDMRDNEAFFKFYTKN